MATKTTKRADKPKVTPAKSKAYPGRKTLTPAQRAEAIALWRSGGVTLADLSKKFGKRAETFSRMFLRMEIVKGSSIPAAAAKLETAIATKVVTAAEETIRKIEVTKTEHYAMSRALARMAWQQLVRAREEKLDVGQLKDVMMTYKLAGDVIGNARKELFAILNVEKHDAVEDFEDLPELTVRELTDNEITIIQTSPADELSFDSDPGADMLPDDVAEGP